jgi:hypothetical protein
MENPDDSNIWRKVKKALTTNNEYSLSIAIIEANRLFLEFIKERGIRSRNSNDAQKYLKKYFSSPEKLAEAISIYEKIVKGESPKLNQNEAKNFVKIYYQAMIDVKDIHAFNLILNKLTKSFNKISKYIYNKFAYILISIILFFALVIILADTQTGQTLIKFIVKLAHLALFSLIPAIVIIFIIAIFFGGLYFYRKRNKNFKNPKITFDDDDKIDSELK